MDPDANLGLALGFDEETLDSIVPISKMRKLIEERTGATARISFITEPKGRRYSGYLWKNL